MRRFALPMLMTLVLGGLASLPIVGAQVTSAPKTELILLGTGTPVPDPSTWGPGSAIVVGKRLFLVDAGAGVTRRLAAAGFTRVHDIEAVFLTHLHSDHTLGYPDLIFTTWIMGRRGPLAVYGPAGLRAMTDHIMQAWSADIDVRVKGLERETRDWLRVDVHEILVAPSGAERKARDSTTTPRGGVPIIVYDRNGVKVTAVAVPHGEWAAFAFRFDAPGRSITFSGDTAPSRALAAAAKGTDVLVHEVYNSKRVKPEDRPGGEYWPEYLRAYHTSDVELGRLAAEARPGQLVLDHVLRFGGSDEEIVAGIRAGGYTGRVVFGKDLDRF